MPCDHTVRLLMLKVYFVQRQIALSASIFFVVMWILVCATTPRPFDLYDYYAYVGVYGVRPLAFAALTSGLDTSPLADHIFQRQLPHAGMLPNLAHRRYMGSARYHPHQSQDLWSFRDRCTDLRHSFILYCIRGSYRSTGPGTSSFKSE